MVENNNTFGIKSYACKFGIENREKITSLDTDFHEFKGSTTTKVNQICKRIDVLEDDMKESYERLMKKIDRLYYLILATALGLLSNILVHIVKTF